MKDKELSRLKKRKSQEAHEGLFFAPQKVRKNFSDSSGKGRRKRKEEENKKNVGRKKKARRKQEERKMTVDGKFTSTEDFRVHSMTEDVMELFEFYVKYRKGYESFPTEKEPNPECRFQFSADTARQALREFYISDEDGFGLMYALDFVEDMLFIDSTTKKIAPSGSWRKSRTSRSAV